MTADGVVVAASCDPLQAANGGDVPPRRSSGGSPPGRAGIQPMLYYGLQSTLASRSARFKRSLFGEGTRRS
jgi:hypothetical protein